MIDDLIIKENYCPLVSVIVITYNSSKYVLETLESVKQQTYENIELIISDDCSTDNTVEVCRYWLDQNHNNFVNTNICVTNTNSGIPANCNLGLSKSQGDWIKFIAGDDILLHDCISVFVDVIRVHSEVKCVLASQFVMSGDVIDKIYIPIKKLFLKDSCAQLKNLMYYGSFPAPAIIYNRNVVDLVGGFDERYPFIEDFPFFMKYLLAGFKLISINIPVVIYRQHDGSITHSNNSKYFDCYSRFYSDLVVPVIKKNRYYQLLWHNYLNSKLVEAVGYDKIFYSFLIRVSDVLYWKYKLYPLFGRTKNLQVIVKKINPISKRDLMKMNVLK